MLDGLEDKCVVSLGEYFIIKFLNFYLIRQSRSATKNHDEHNF